jgi:NAD-specific glutamate dehydrogenase
LRDSAGTIHRRAAERVLALSKEGRAETRVNAWADAVGEDLARWQRTLTDMRASGASDFATLSVGIDSVRKLTDVPLARK